MSCSVPSRQSRRHSEHRIMNLAPIVTKKGKERALSVDDPKNFNTSPNSVTASAAILLSAQRISRVNSFRRELANCGM